MSQKRKNKSEHEKLENLYQNALKHPCGHTIEYRGYTLEKTSWSHPEHDEYQIKNRDGKVVETYTITTFDSLRDLKQRLHQIIDQNPPKVKEPFQG